MAARDLNIAIVGYGKIALKHVEVLRALGARVEASCNRSEAGRLMAKNEGKIQRTYASIDEMLDAERPDGIVCLVTAPQMFSAAKAILPRALPTLLEKPPGTSLEELHTLRALAAQHETPVMVGLNRRHYSVVTRAIEDAGGPGAITSVSIEWSEDPIHVLKRLQPHEVARWIFGNSLHGLDMLTTLGGPIDDPFIVAKNMGEPFRWAMGLLGRSRRGAIASFRSTWDSPAKWRVTFTARDRQYLFAPLETCTVSERGKDDRVIAPSEDDKQFKAGFLVQARAYLDGIRSGAMPPEHDLASTIPAMTLAEKLTDAVKTAPA